MTALISFDTSIYANNMPANKAAQTPHYSPEDVVKNFGEDALVIAEGENSDDPYKKNLALLMKFVDANGTMSGAAGSCIPSEQIYIEMCVNLTISHWKDITGFDLNTVKLDNDKSFKEVVKNAFKKQEDNAFQYMGQHSELCNSFIEQERQSPLWNNCDKTGAEKNEMPKTDMPDTTNLQ